MSTQNGAITLNLLFVYTHTVWHMWPHVGCSGGGCECDDGYDDDDDEDDDAYDDDGDADHCDCADDADADSDYDYGNDT